MSYCTPCSRLTCYPRLLSCLLPRLKSHFLPLCLLSRLHLIVPVLPAIPVFSPICYPLFLSYLLPTVSVLSVTFVPVLSATHVSFVLSYLHLMSPVLPAPLSSVLLRICNPSLRSYLLPLSLILPATPVVCPTCIASLSSCHACYPCLASIPWYARVCAGNSYMSVELTMGFPEGVSP